MQKRQVIFQTSTQTCLAQLQKGKQRLVQILKNSPIAGVYSNQKELDWDHFFHNYLSFLKQQQGPRGQCAKHIRTLLLQNQEEINQLLKPYSQTAKTHIRDIYMKFTNSIPCEEYKQRQKLKDNLQKMQQNFSKLNDSQSIMHKIILKGLIQKHGLQFDFKGTFQKLKQGYRQKIQQITSEIERVQMVLDCNPCFQHYQKVKQKLEPYFKMWQTCDSGVGKSNCSIGKSFQLRVNQTLVPFLLNLERESVLKGRQPQVFINCSWIPKSIGEIDIAFGYFITTLIQCKSRLYDIREAYRQVSLKGQDIQLFKTFGLQQLKALTKKNKTSLQKIQTSKLQSNRIKKFISTKYGPAQLLEDHSFYIVTCIPQYQFVLPFESSLKEALQRSTKNLFIEDYDSKTIYKALRQKFADTESPFQWYLKLPQKLKQRILVLR